MIPDSTVSYGLTVFRCHLSSNRLTMDFGDPEDLYRLVDG